MPEYNEALLKEIETKYYKERDANNAKNKPTGQDLLTANSETANRIRDEYVAKFIAAGEKNGKFPVEDLAAINRFVDVFNERVDNVSKSSAADSFKIPSKHSITKDENGVQIFETGKDQSHGYASHTYSQKDINGLSKLKGLIEAYNPMSDSKLDNLIVEAKKIAEPGVIDQEGVDKLKQLSKDSAGYNIAVMNTKNKEGVAQSEIIIYAEGKGKDAVSIPVKKETGLTLEDAYSFAASLDGVTSGSDKSNNKGGAVNNATKGRGGKE